jgi:DNA polymerase III subunit delta'
VRFAEVIGQEEVKARLRHAFHDGRLAHAIMFLGPEGSGNLPLALAFAQYIACPVRTELDSCGTCPTCRKISTNQYADLHFTFPFFNKSEGSGDRKTTCDDWLDKWRPYLNENPYANLDQWRETITEDNKRFHISVYEAGSIIQKLSLKSFEGGYKFQVIWMAEYLKPETANKLLKIVEEPPDRTLFFFVAVSSENILQTILSRTQTIYVPRIEDNDMMRALLEKGLALEKAEDMAHFAHGDWNKALQLVSAQNPDENYAEKFQLWMRMCYKKELPYLVRWADEMHKLPREEQKHFLTYALDQVRQNLVLNYTGEQLVRMNDYEKDFSRKFSPFINDLNAEDLMQEIEEAHGDISQNAYSKMVLTDLSVKVHYLLTRKQ